MRNIALRFLINYFSSLLNIKCALRAEMRHEMHMEPLLFVIDFNHIFQRV